MLTPCLPRLSQVPVVDVERWTTGGRVRRRSSRARPPVALGDARDKVDESAHRHSGFEGVAEPLATSHQVAVATAHAQAQDHTGALEIGDDLLRGALSDPDGRCDVAEADVRISGHTHEHVPVVGEEGLPVPLHVNDVIRIPLRTNESFGHADESLVPPHVG